MKKPKDAVGEKTVYPHALMHSAARCALGFAESTEDGSYYQSLLCCISMAFCLEAYFNFLGEQVISNWKAEHEREEPKEKLKSLAKTVGFNLDTRSKEYDAFTRVFALRNALAHGKVTSVAGEWRTAEKGTNPILALETDWEKLAETKAARLIYKRCTELVVALHRAAGQVGDPFGSSSHGIGHVWTETDL
jgi:hypothetical protein